MKLVRVVDVMSGRLTISGSKRFPIGKKIYIPTEKSPHNFPFPQNLCYKTLL